MAHAHPTAKSLANLRPFNKMPDDERLAMNARGGKNKKKNADERKKCAEILRIIVEKIYKDKNGNQRDGREALMVRLFRKALDGDVQALKLILLLLDEMPTPELKLKSSDPSDNGILDGLLEANLEIQKKVMREGENEKTGAECTN